MKRVLFGCIVMSMSAFAATTAGSAAEYRTFNAQAFMKAQKEGRSILIEAYADWCPICRVQSIELERVTKDPAYDRIIVFRTVYEKDKSFWRSLRIQRQSTLIAFSGFAEKGRSVGDVLPDTIRSLIRSSL